MSNLFGNNSSNTGFGSGNTSSLFGNLNNTSSSSTTSTTQPSLFGGGTSNATAAPSGGLFGSAGSASGGFNVTKSNEQQGSTGQQGPSVFGGGFSTPDKSSGPESNSQNQTQTSNIFGNNSTQQSGTSTPQAGKPLFSFNNPASTTPAGPPPSSSSGGLFNLNQTSGSSNNLFGGGRKSPDKQNDQQSSTNASTAPSLFGTSGQSSNPSQPSTNTNLFGSVGQSSTSATQQSSGGFFASAAPKTSSNLFGHSTAQSQSGTGGATSNLFGSAGGQSQSGSGGATNNLFGGGANNAKSAENTSAGQSQGQSDQDPNKGKSTFQFPSSQNQQPSNNLFQAPSMQNSKEEKPASYPSLGGASKDASAQNTASTGAEQKQTPNLFGAMKSSASTSSSTSAPASNLFGGATSSASSSSNLFGNPGQKKDETASSSTTQPATSNATSTAPANASSVFGGANKTDQGSSASQSAAPATSTTQSSTQQAAAGPSNFGSSISGPAPTPQSRLKNKSMDEIITRWASDLSKYQKEFQAQADKVATWDRMLVDNSNAISKLYSKTFQAERDTAEVQKQLSLVESHQDELEGWLDKYEKEVDDMMSRQVGQGETLQGPDQERERTYKSAERVQERLNEMGKDLTTMIEEINSASAAITKTNKPDDPLSQIVRILNNHLLQLQQIDQDTSILQAKITAAQKDSQRLGYRAQSGLRDDAADSFYNSFMRKG